MSTAAKFDKSVQQSNVKLHCLDRIQGGVRKGGLKQVLIAIHKYTNTQNHKYTNTRIHRYTNTQGVRKAWIEKVLTVIQIIYHKEISLTRVAQ